MIDPVLKVEKWRGLSLSHLSEQHPTYNLLRPTVDYHRVFPPGGNNFFARLASGGGQLEKISIVLLTVV